MATYTLNSRISALRQMERDLPDKLSRAMKSATMRAVEEAVNLTPPTGDDLSGTNTRTGEMKQSWVTSSKTEPVRKGSVYETELNNNMEYASYVNDGHTLTKHFVPGLVINDAGILDRNPDGKGGLMVGTKTTFVEGRHITEKAVDVWRGALKSELRRLHVEVGQ